MSLAKTVPRALARRINLAPVSRVRFNSGPGGQQRRPESPGGPEAIRRNWVPIGGAALAAFAVAYVYNSNQKSSLERAKREVRETTKKSMDKMSGNDKQGQGAFRSE